ncbi:sensor histidine kinase [Gephyromycinifex aptenodytis]|uniref:sensor histidine kinase n=1 Tax=Gephyromycinifex aptenodytis TaxID=2716227 RepID=UPI001D00BCA9|nr:HAMP domain-containing sensor histidine kinase [Gephyromycinifex aptenodytis]
MHGALLRSTLFTVVFAMAVFGAPLLALGLGLVDVKKADLVIAYVTLFTLLAVVGAVLLARNQARRFAVPLEQLADQAEALGAGIATVERLHSGLPEIDRVSASLASSATRLQRALSTERDFASDASHQLRTPLTALLMRLEEITATQDLRDAQEEATLAIEQVERLNVTVDALLARARQGSSESPRPTSVDAVIAGLQREWQPTFEAQSRSVQVSGDRGLRVIATPVALQQILATLLENALVHGDGTVEIDARRSGPSVVLEVRNAGPGVEPGLAPHIFERSVSTRSTGLGLALARDLAERYGGRLDLLRAASPVVFALFMSSADEVDQ